ncbi:ribosomal protein S14 (chloroplast) [Klebsormidium nitens]|jgi:small subunit ribosomal protein S14|uniref:Small ribosomal subunit protein uS14c n=2 Tax=Klebsormidium TaxID=3174 RepID=A0A0U9HNL0_KLENI|nr:ribosomal protein S14 [Klebsormidium flaccidum]YP_009033682.1 ribosomal protein S14 [Klebsormidium flaccidum]WKT07399.1 ribosomal protein S14 [Klebsormidium nitens]WKT07948.1 ribosomal protein S14 [Klebsormidium sp. LDpt]WKT08057.1 ribosomal protein S14 [Klebsormidium sp. SAG 2107]AHZ11023.1 ribosomal protein S14 [Klebsormidium flaccidum]AHZ11065.1 ribosomal protein S14 [Klebsormidium flaccidum]|eukprot:GAQ93706.1 ribosomal protein S14 (chloroplast) [Klebsormidium nitens]
MAKKSLVQRDKKRELLIAKHRSQRHLLLQKVRHEITLEKRWELYKSLLALPRDSSPSRLRRRCFITGRARGYYRDFGVSRHVLRKMAHLGNLPGVTKSSW